jgi:hypothetical protein
VASFAKESGWGSYSSNSAGLRARRPLPDRIHYMAQCHHYVIEAYTREEAKAAVFEYIEIF